MGEQSCVKSDVLVPLTLSPVSRAAHAIFDNNRAFTFVNASVYVIRMAVRANAHSQPRICGKRAPNLRKVCGRRAPICGKSAMAKQLATAAVTRIAQNPQLAADSDEDGANEEILV